MYIYVIESSNPVLDLSFAFSMDIIFTFDCIYDPELSISAIAKYLLSLEILVSTTLVLDKNVTNFLSPFGL